MKRSPPRARQGRLRGDNAEESFVFFHILELSFIFAEREIIYILQEEAGASRVGWTKRVEVFLVEQAWRIYIKRHSAGCVCLVIA